jgi:hypothetical protein
MVQYKTYIRAMVQRMVAFLLAVNASVSTADVPARIFPFAFTESGLHIESVDFGQVSPSSFHQRFIAITNNSSQELKNVAIRITGNYKVSNCMSEFLPGTSCNVILNYKAPAHASWDIKWLTIEFTVQQADGSTHSHSQRLSVVGGVQLPEAQSD